MYGLVPSDIEWLRVLVDTSLTQVCIGAYDLQFRFTDERACISIEGRCELIDPAGVLVDVWDRGVRSTTFRFTELLMKQTVDVRIDTPRSFLLTFEEGWALRVIDNSDKFESFSVANAYV